ncbi:hypothetical protein ACHAWC_007159 [Mediolabrus comicus]
MSVLGLESDRAVLTSSSSSLTQSTLIGASSHAMSQEDESDIDLDGKKTDKIIWQLLQKAENDDEMWVRVVAGILRGMMFKSSSENANIEEVEAVNHYENTTCRGKTAEEELKKITNEIMQSVRETAKEASANLHDNEESHNELSVLVGKDCCPSFAPMRYSLLSADTIRSVLPEADSNLHFKANMEASIFKVDAEIEEKRAEEESKETNIQKRTNLTSVKSNISSDKASAVGRRPVNGNPAASNGTGNRADLAMLTGRGGRGRFANGVGRGGRGGRDSGASLFRPSNGLAGRGSRGRGAPLAGRSGSLSRLAGTGRATAAAGKAPLARRVPGSKQALLNSSARGKGGDSSKMKMIDVSEVQGLNRAQQVREQLTTKEARKRKLMEDAKASGLRKEKKVSAPTSIKGGNGGATTGATTNNNGTQSSWESLLEKSNKLSDDDRQNIRQFFEQRTLNPTSQSVRPEGTDESGVWRCKLNEDKTTDPHTGELVKETLYLDLDFNTLGYKKTRKIKKK